MFLINKNGNIILYKIKIGDNLYNLLRRIIKENGNITHKKYTTDYTPNFYNNIYVFNYCERYTGETRSYNDFYSEDRDIYEVNYDISDNIEIVDLLLDIKDGEYESLKKIVKYNLNNYDNIKSKNYKNQLIFNKYKDEIFENIKLRKIKELDNLYFLLKELYRSSKDDLKERLKKVKKELNVLKIDNIDSLISNQKIKMKS